MNKHFLLTVSADRTASWSVRFIADFFRNKQKCELTLFYTARIPEPPRATLPSYEERQEMEQLQDARGKMGRRILQVARDALLASGFSGDNVHEKIHFCHYSKALDILKEGEDGLYDAIVLGRRGLGWVEELVESSVSHEILNMRGTVPVWICRVPQLGQRHVLACVDDSEQAMRMVDHVGFVLADEPEHDITLLNVYDPGSGDRIFAEEIFSRCKEILQENAIPPERVHTRMVESYNTSKVILRLAENFAVVAVGRTGEDRGLMRKLFLGSVSTTLYRQLQGRALWLCL